ncbi:hypothetical protein CCMA1212_004117 [Trichoderma ghanense]|uniref:Uncharacterized protein n=1 Tax=Trichoderma ghanense TaxID=65468 RepID=A0ABY2H8K6_9HYPO
MPSFTLSPPILHLPLRTLLLPPLLLAMATTAALFLHSDVDIALLWSRCHARAQIPALSRVPLLGTPSCFLVSFFHAALDSLRSRAVMAAVLAYVGALATVCTVEAARRCNRSSGLIARPTVWWLLFNLLGGAVVWQLVIVPAFLHRAKALVAAAEEEEEEEEDDAVRTAEERLEDRTLPDSEAVAIPIAVAVGYFVPSALMLALHSPATIGIWLLFPLYVSIVRQAVRYVVERIRRASPVSIHHESHWQCVVLVYALPIALSVAAHVLLLWNIARHDDDRKKMTRLTASFIEIDVQFIAFTVLYWVFVEAGWRVPLAMVAISVVAGPGAGVCLGWLLRERLVKYGFAGRKARGEEEDGRVGEERPLLG